MWIDKFIQKKVESSYLWLYDWTGVYVGQLMMLLGFLIFAENLGICLKQQPNWFWSSFFLLVLVGDGYGRSHIQHLGLNHLYNAYVLDWIHSIWRTMSIIANATFLFTTMVVIDVKGMVYFLAVLVFLYLRGVMIRDREPRSFQFHRQMAASGAS